MKTEKRGCTSVCSRTLFSPRLTPGTFSADPTQKLLGPLLPRLHPLYLPALLCKGLDLTHRFGAFSQQKIMKTFLDTWSTRLYEKCSQRSKDMQMIYFQGMSTSNYLHIFTAMQRFEMKIWNQNHAFSEALCRAGKCFLHSASGGQKCLQRAEDGRCLLRPSGMAVGENELLDCARGAERGRTRCWHKLFPCSVVAAYPPSRSASFLLWLCFKLNLPSFPRRECARMWPCPHCSASLCPWVPDVTNLSSCGTQPGPNWVLCYTRGWPDNNKEEYSRTRKVAKKCNKNDQRSGVSSTWGAQSRPKPIFLEKRYWEG